MPLRETILRKYAERFGGAPTFIVRAPGRVNLIGEHTDYNDGFVLPLAIERAVWIALRPRTDREIRLFSLDYDDEIRFDLDTIAHGGEVWSEYVKGTAGQLVDAGHALRGWEGVMAGDVPIGAGLSSSAALELATARACAAASDLPWDPVAMARLAQRAEKEWVGMECGIMDQMISAVGREDHAVLIDCRSLETRAVPLPSGTVVVILDTGTRRGLVDSAYNDRRRQCEAAARFFGVPALRDVSPSELEANATNLDAVTARRARHVITENARTLAAVEAMAADDAAALGRLMDASHESLRDDFEVSSPALDAMVGIARLQAGCHGARMTGAGFGGCAVALVDVDAAAAFTHQVAVQYQRETGVQASLFATRASGGTAIDG